MRLWCCYCQLHAQQSIDLIEEVRAGNAPRALFVVVVPMRNADAAHSAVPRAARWWASSGGAVNVALEDCALTNQHGPVEWNGSKRTASQRGT